MLNVEPSNVVSLKTCNAKVKGLGFLSFTIKYEKKLLDAGLGALTTAFKKVVHKAGEFLGNKTSDTVTMIKLSNLMKIKKF